MAEFDFVISGLNPGKGGVPMFLDYLEKNNFRLCYPVKSNSIIGKILSKIVFFMRILMYGYKSKKFLIMHHQSIPFYVLLYIVYFCKYDYFAIDNSYFCIKSYNYNKKYSKTSCSKCLLDVKPLSSCNVFPSKRLKLFEVFILKKIRQDILSKRVSIYSLSNSSSNLISQSLPGAKVHTIGFTTVELENCIKKNYEITTNSKSLVFHGNALEAKGINYFILLSKYLPNYNFIIPTHGISFDNVKYVDCSWDTGLLDLILKSHIVFVPSLWDNTPEASTIKSMLLNKPVAYFPTKHSFENEFSECIGIKLTGNLLNDSIQIKDFNSIVQSKELAENFLNKSKHNLLDVLRPS